MGSVQREGGLGDLIATDSRLEAVNWLGVDAAVGNGREFFVFANGFSRGSFIVSHRFFGNYKVVLAYIHVNLYDYEPRCN